MKLVVADAPALKAAIDSIVNLVEEGIFELKKDGVHLKAMDPSQISMISFTMPTSAFAEYQLDVEQKVGLNLSQLASILARGKHGERVELLIDEGRFVVRFLGEKKRRTFKIPLLEIGGTIQKEPKINFTSFVKINGDVLKETLKDAKLLSSHVKLMIEKDVFVVDVKGEEGDVRAEFESGGLEVSEIKTEKGAKATFPLQYLEDIVKASSAATQIKINLETDKPLQLEYEVAGARAVYYLAPRIETE